jgi:predicted Zn-dependent peptidase
LGWHKPPLPTHDAVIFDVLQYILSDNGRSSRLYSELVKKRGLCESVATFTAPGEKYPNLLCIWATPRAPHSPSEVESAVWDVLHELERDGVTSEELEMSVAKAESSIVRDLDSDLGRAKRIGYLYLITRDPAYLDKYLMALKSVTVSDIQRVVHDYLRRDNVTVATIDKGVVGHDATAQDRSTRGGKKSLGGPAMLNYSGGRRR